MEYRTDYIQWDFDRIKEEFDKLIPKGCTPFILYYYKEYDEANSNSKGDEAYLMATYNDKNEIYVFDIIINKRSKYEMQFPSSFVSINFERFVMDNYLDDGYHHFHYDNIHSPKMFICEKFDDRFMQSITLFQECHRDGVIFDDVILLYIEPENKSNYGKCMKQQSYDGADHDKLQIETSLYKIIDDVYRIYNINFFFILVVYYSTNAECYKASVYNRVINIESKLKTYERFWDMGVDEDSVDEVMDNIRDYINYDMPKTRFGNIFAKYNLLIDKS